MLALRRVGWVLPFLLILIYISPDYSLVSKWKTHIFVWIILNAGDTLEIFASPDISDPRDTPRDTLRIAAPPQGRIVCLNGSWGRSPMRWSGGAAWLGLTWLDAAISDPLVTSGYRGRIFQSSDLRIGCRITMNYLQVAMMAMLMWTGTMTMFNRSDKRD